MGIFSPKVEIRNNGSAALTSAQIEISMNGTLLGTVDWSGNLGFLETEWVELGEYNFAIEDLNSLEISLVSVNGSDDEYPANNMIVREIPAAPVAPTTITLLLKLDENPEETTWEVTDHLGNVVYSGGPYTNAGQVVVESLTFSTTDCYTFTIYDAGGDGLVNGGNYALGFGSTVIAQGGAFGSMDYGQFSILITGIEDQASGEMKLFPVPAVSNLYVQAPESVSDGSYRLIASDGTVAVQGSFAGNRKTIDISRLAPGVYTFVLSSNAGQWQQRVIISE